MFVFLIKDALVELHFLNSVLLAVALQMIKGALSGYSVFLCRFLRSKMAATPNERQAFAKLS